MMGIPVLIASQIAQHPGQAITIVAMGLCVVIAFAFALWNTLRKDG